MQIIRHSAAPAPGERFEGPAAQGLLADIVPVPERALFETRLPRAGVIWRALHVRGERGGAEAVPRPEDRRRRDHRRPRSRRRGRHRVCDIPRTNTRAVFEMTRLLTLGALRRVAQRQRAMRKGRGWETSRLGVRGSGPGAP